MVGRVSFLVAVTVSSAGTFVLMSQLFGLDYGGVRLSAAAGEQEHLVATWGERWRREEDRKEG